MKYLVTRQIRGIATAIVEANSEKEAAKLSQDSVIDYEIDEYEISSLLDVELIEELN